MGELLCGVCLRMQPASEFRYWGKRCGGRRSECRRCHARRERERRERLRQDVLERLARARNPSRLGAAVIARFGGVRAASALWVALIREAVAKNPEKALHHLEAVARLMGKAEKIPAGGG